MAYDCNNDLRDAAEDFLAQAKQIADEEPIASMRRATLYRAAAHALLSLADLTALPIVTKCSVCMPAGFVNPSPGCHRCNGTGWHVTP